MLAAFNRTIVELKHISNSATTIEAQTFNRTIVELKQCCKSKWTTTRRLLIVP